MAAKRKTLVQQVMEQVINYGGIAATRAQVYSHSYQMCFANLEGEPNRERRAQAAADLFACGSRAKELTPDEIACRIPWDFAVANGLLD